MVFKNKLGQKIVFLKSLIPHKILLFVGPMNVSTVDFMFFSSKTFKFDFKLPLIMSFCLHPPQSLFVLPKNALFL